MSTIISYLMMLLSGSLFAQSETVLTIPGTVFLQAGLSTTFVAKFALFVAFLLLWTLACGEIFKALFRLPSIAGQIIGGILLGPSWIDIRNIGYFAQPLQLLDGATGQLYALAASDLFIFFVLLLSSAFTVSYLLWIAGHETDVGDIIKVGTTAVSVGVLGALVPVVMTVGTYYVIGGADYSFAGSLGLGLVFAATSVSIPVAMLFAQNKMHLKSSKATLGAAIIDDIVAVVLLSMFFICLQSGMFGEVTGMVASEHAHSLTQALVKMLMSFVVIFSVGYFAIPPFLQWIKKQHHSHLLTSMAHGIMMLYFAFAELVGGLAGITGSYFSGLFHRMGDVKHQAQLVISPFVNAILLPLFLGSIGLQVDISVLNVWQWGMVVLLLVVAIISKLLACFVATGASNLANRRGSARWTMLESYLFGASMVARGEVGLVISTILQGTGLITPEQYVICVVVIILTTIAAPIMLSIGFYYLDRDTAVSDEQEYTMNLGLFPVIGTQQMFNVITSRLSSEGKSTSISISEGRTIVHLEKEGVKIILCPEEGILLRGKRRKINEIIAMIKQAVIKEVEKVKEA